MKSMFIPPLGFELELREDWHFKLFNELRNTGLIRAAGMEPPQVALPDFWSLSTAEKHAAYTKSVWRLPNGDIPSGREVREIYDVCAPFVLRAGTRLKVDRIYMRRGQSDFDSVTFRCNLWASNFGDPLFTASRRLKSFRFWAKLDDVNKIIFEEVSA